MKSMLTVRRFPFMALVTCHFLSASVAAARTNLRPLSPRLNIARTRPMGEQTQLSSSCESVPIATSSVRYLRMMPPSRTTRMIIRSVKSQDEEDVDEDGQQDDGQAARGAQQSRAVPDGVQGLLPVCSPRSVPIS